MPPTKAVVVNGWTLLAHAAFLDRLETLIGEVEAAKAKDPLGYKKKNAAKQLAAIRKLVFEVVPQNPEAPEFRQGETLDGSRKHWFRAKFFQQYRLFFRFHKKTKIIIFAWVNDDDAKRAYGSKSDAYRTFGKMLNAGRPADEWAALLKEARAEAVRFASLEGEAD